MGKEIRLHRNRGLRNLLFGTDSFYGARTFRSRMDFLRIGMDRNPRVFAFGGTLRNLSVTEKGESQLFRRLRLQREGTQGTIGENTPISRIGSKCV